MTMNLEDVRDIDRAAFESTATGPVGASAKPKDFGLAAVADMERRARLAVMDRYLTQPFAVRSVHRESRRVAALRFGGLPQERAYSVHDYVVYADLYRMLGPAKIGRALDLLAIQVDKAVDVCRDPTNETLAFEAHDLCGSAGMLGFMDLGAVSRRVQTVLAADTLNSHEYDAALNAFAVALGRAKRTLSALRAAITTDLVHRVCCDRLDREEMVKSRPASWQRSDELGHLV